MGVTHSFTPYSFLCFAVIWSFWLLLWLFSVVGAPGCCGSGYCGCLGTGCFCGVFGVGSRYWLILGFLPEYFGVVGGYVWFGYYRCLWGLFWGHAGK